MKLLCVDTATPVESVAVLDGEELLVERAVRRRRGHGPGILDDIDAALRDAGFGLDEVGGFVSGLGPGSFTGLRVALATLKGLALATGKPIYGARTTAALCAGVPDGAVAAVLDARRGEVYVDGPGLDAPACVKPEAIGRLLSGPVTLVGDGARVYAAQLRGALPEARIPDAPGLHVPRAALLAGLVDLDAPAALATLEPVYVRRSDAEIHYPQGFPDALGRLPT